MKFKIMLLIACAFFGGVIQAQEAEDKKVEQTIGRSIGMGIARGGFVGIVLGVMCRGTLTGNYHVPFRVAATVLPVLLTAYHRNGLSDTYDACEAGLGASIGLALYMFLTH